MTEDRPISLRRLLPRWLARSLSAQLLVLTVLFVMLAEVLIYVPSIANYRLTWLMDRLNAAQTASLAVEAAGAGTVMPQLEAELLRNAEVLAVALKRDDRRELLLSAPMPGMIAARYDLRQAGAAALIVDALETLVSGGGRTIAVVAEPRFGGGAFIEAVIDETRLREDMLAYSRNILLLSVVISIVTAALVFLVLDRALVRPMTRITENMVRFRLDPEDAERAMVPSDRRDEIGIAERELAMMQADLRQALRQKTRLAALGTAVAKINHDLRNILASAQLISDRLGRMDDPRVQALAPRLLASLDRAIALATGTMTYGRAEEAPPRKQWLPVADLAREAVDAVLTDDDGDIRVQIAIGADERVFADPDHLFRILLNLVRNAVQAMRRTGDATGGTLRIGCEQTAAGAALSVADTGPGLPDTARAHLFEPFAGSAGGDGTGLGLAVAADLASLNGGRLELAESGPGGTVFLVRLPPAPAVPHRP